MRRRELNGRGDKRDGHRGGGMDLKLLGELSVHEGGTPITPTEAQTRQVLALLATQADHMVPTAVLVEELWPAGPPRRATDMLEGHVRHVRALIQAALAHGQGRAGDTHSERRTAHTVLAGLPGGYRLHSGGGTSDVAAFEREAGAGYRAMETEDFETAASRLRGALALWSGEPYSGVLTGPHLRAHASRLEHSWQRALDQWMSAEAQLGRCRALLDDLVLFLSRFRAQQPLYEGLMHELRHTGDPRGILATYQRVRRRSQAAAPANAPLRGTIPRPAGWAATSASRGPQSAVGAPVMRKTYAGGPRAAAGVRAMA